MRLKLATLNAVNFAIIFGVISTKFGSVFGINSIYLDILIWLVIGFVVAEIVNLFFKKKNDDKIRHKMPDKVSTKLVLIPSVLLFLIIGIAVLYFVGIVPFNFSANVVGEVNNETEVVEETVEETVEEVLNGCDLMEGLMCEDVVIEKNKNKIRLDIANLLDESLRSVSITITDLDGLEEICELACVIGCDGGRTMYAGETTTWVSVDCEGITTRSGVFESLIDFGYTGSDGNNLIYTGKIRTEI